MRLSIISAVLKLKGLNFSSLDVAKLAYKDQLQTQGKASGYDIINQCLGGLVITQKSPSATQWPGSYKKISNSSHVYHNLKNFHVFVGGKGAPTAPLIKETSAIIAKHGVEAALLEQSEKLIDSLISGDCPKQIMPKIISLRDLFRNTPAFSHKISNVLESIPGFDVDFTWKHTGAGGEDAILVFGAISSKITSSLSKIGYQMAPFSLENFPLE